MVYLLCKWETIQFCKPAEHSMQAYDEKGDGKKRWGSASGTFLWKGKKNTILFCVS